MIGGEHHLSVPAEVKDSLGDLIECELGYSTYFATGRDALATLLTSLAPLHIHLPDLMCASIHDACRIAGKERLIYRIGADLLHEPLQGERWRIPSLVLVMHYFGIRDDLLMQRARAAGHLVISDVTHLLFDAQSLKEAACKSDYLFASLRKSGPLPDGGFVSSLTLPPPAPAQGLRVDFFARRTAGLMSRGFSALQSFSDDENFLLLKQAEHELDESEPGGYSCSYLSRQLIRTISVPDAAAAIRRNIAILRNGLRGICDVPEGEFLSPYLPCFFASCESRDQVRAALAAQRFFFPVHWPATGLSVSSPLSERSLSIPCDARYGALELLAALEIIKSCLSD